MRLIRRLAINYGAAPVHPVPAPGESARQPVVQQGQVQLMATQGALVSTLVIVMTAFALWFAYVLETANADDLCTTETLHPSR